MALLNLLGNHPSWKHLVARAASTAFRGSLQAFRKPIGSRSSPGAFHGLAFDRAPPIASAETGSQTSNFGSQSSTKSGSWISPRLASGLGKNLPARALALLSWVERSRPSRGPARAGSFRGSGGLKLL